MEPLFFILILLSIASFLMVYFFLKYELSKEKIKTLEKKLYGNMTDFEMLSEAIKLKNKVDFDKLRPDEIENWTKIVQKWSVELIERKV